MYSGQTIVLKNLRQVPPNTAEVIRLQRQLIEAVQRYQELVSQPDKDEAAVQQLLKEISIIDQCQRQELNVVREAEIKNGTSIQDSRTSTGSSICDSAPENEVSEDDHCAQEALSPSCQDGACGQPDTIMEESEEEPEQTEDSPMDWEDLSREQWTESDRLLQKVERVGSKMVQRDFLSCVDLVHVSQYKKAEETLVQRKLRDLKGKKVITTGPWQMIDIPTKVTNRRCNYLTGLHVTVRQKDPKRIAMQNTGIEIGGVKTRHHDSRGSSRTSSRASSPVFQVDSLNKECNTSSTIAKLRKTRGLKGRKAALAQARPNNNNNNSAKQSSSSKISSPSSTQSTNTAIDSGAATKNASRTLEPCVTYTVVDGVPHFKVFFPSNDSKGTKPSFTPHASIVESDIEVHASTPNENGRLSPKSKSSPKPIKRPRLSQSSCSPPSLSPKSLSNPETSSSKEDLLESNQKCGSWMSSPHFKIYRTFLTSSESPGSSNVPAPPKPVIAPAPKLTSPTPAPKLAIASKSTALPAMPKLTIGNQAFKTSTVAPAPTGGKFVPIAPKVSTNLAPSVSNIVIVPLNETKNSSAEKRPVSLLKACTSTEPIKRPAVSLLKACTPFSNSQNPSSTGTFLTVKNLKECLQNSKSYKDMKVVVQKVPVTAAVPAQQAPRLSLADAEDLKQKVVKLFPSADAKDQQKSDENPVPTPTIIVADMSV